MKYAFIDEQRAGHSVKRLCQALDVSPSGYYAWRRRGPSPRRLANQALLVQIRASHARSQQTYGSPRVHAELVAQGRPCSRKRVARLMRQAHLQARPRRRFRPQTTQADPQLLVAPNRLGRPFQANAPNQVWLSDVTYVPTAEGWLYLAVVLDPYPRRVVGWAMNSRLDTSLVLAALRQALGRRQPPATLLHHSDRGSQYASAAYQAALAEHGAQVSMSRAGNCYDNAPLESFFVSLKVERVHQRRYRTRAEARQHIVAYIEGFYNPTRRHSALDYRSPLGFELYRARTSGRIWRSS
jgi:putative transposase